MTEKLNKVMKQYATIAEGGPIFEMAAHSSGDLFMASPAGVLRQEADGWQLLMRGVPFWRVNSVAAAGRQLFLSGMPNGIVRSFDNGERWSRCFVDQTDAPVVKMVVSPNYAKDKVLLAATAGDGVLRSTDGGRHWQLSNFGLRDFDLLDLATAPAWNVRYEFVFAISETGIYQSPNGGRAWRRGECEDEIRPLAIAVSPNFADDQTVIVGTEIGQLYRSTDAGRSWHLLADGFEMINALCFVGDDLLIGAMTTVVSTSLADLEKRRVSLDVQLPLLSLSLLAGKVYATFVDGVVCSEDNGRLWQPIENFAARRFVWVQRVEDAIIAAGPEEGVWLSIDEGKSWRLIWADSTVLTLDFSREFLLVSSDVGLFISTDLGTSWQRVDAFDEPILAAAQFGITTWLGSHSGTLRRLDQQSMSVQKSDPFGRCQLLEMQRVGGELITAVYQPGSREVQLWILEPDQSGWRQIFSERSQPLKPIVAFDAEMGLLVGLESKLYVERDGSWQSIRVTTADAPITAVYTQADIILVGATNSLLELNRADLSQQTVLLWSGGPILDIVGKGETWMITAVNGELFLGG